MPELLIPSFYTLTMTVLSCCVLREVFVLSLPDTVAGPGGWLVNTRR